MGQITMIVATERDHYGMASGTKFSEVVPVTIKPVDFYAIDVQMSMPLSSDVILTRVFGSKTKMLNNHFCIPA
tara:strand:- start:336 stop:554 length:219 start_codon:yes stop_codon:yes gene_type:complete